jgi:hypothetical protein
MAAISLREFLRARLSEQDAVARPDEESWQAMIDRIRPLGRVSVVDDETFDYFLDCLPPKTMFKGGFAFAEGAEPLRLFWRRNGMSYTRQLSWDETHEFCCLADIPVPE